MDFRFQRIALVAAGAVVLAAAPLAAQGSDRIPRGKGFPQQFHDPSMPVKEGDTWWVLSTGNGIATRYSKDLKTWEQGPPVFKEFPAWHKEVVPSQRGHLWAPDLIRVKDRYRVYYSVSAFGKNTSAIGLVSGSMLGSNGPERLWRDEGIVVRSGEKDTFNAIDPQPFIDADGRNWLVFGSFWRGIHLLELDPATGLAHPERKQLRQIAWHEEIEAPAILRHGDFYYLFVNWGLCCRGVDSTYEIRIGRSKSVTGPYQDREGNDLATGGGTLLLGSAGDRIGPGHASFVTRNGITRMFYHYYDRKFRGFATLGSADLKWSRDGWPEVAAH